jgi:hypothetical protein
MVKCLGRLDGLSILYFTIGATLGQISGYITKLIRGKVRRVASFTTAHSEIPKPKPPKVLEKRRRRRQPQATSKCRNAAMTNWRPSRYKARFHGGWGGLCERVLSHPSRIDVPVLQNFSIAMPISTMCTGGF